MRYVGVKCCCCFGLASVSVGFLKPPSSIGRSNGSRQHRNASYRISTRENPSRRGQSMVAENSQSVPTQLPKRNRAYYSNHLKGLSTTKFWAIALNTLDTMRENNMVPNIRDYRHVLKALAKSGQHEEALILIEEMRTVYGVMPDILCYMHSIQACGEGGAPDFALVLLGDMKDNGITPDVWCYNAAMQASTKARDGSGLDRAIELIQTMKEEGIRPDEVSFSTAINAAAIQDDNWQAAYELLQEMKTVDPPLPPHRPAYNAMLKALARAKQWGPAIGLLAEMRDDVRCPPPDIISLTTTMDACTNAGRPDIALRIFLDGKLENGAWRRGEGEGGLPMDIVFYGSALKACAEMSRLESKYTGADSHLIGQGRSTARGILEEMRAGPSHLRPNAIAYSCMVTACCLGANRGVDGAEEALQLIKDMRADGIMATPACYTSLMTALAEGRKGVEALELLEEITALGMGPNLIWYNCAINACSKSGMYRQAVHILHLMRTKGFPPNQRAYGAAISACGYAGKWQMAISLLNELRTGVVQTSENGATRVPHEFQPGFSLGKYVTPGGSDKASPTVTFQALVPDIVCYSACIDACNRGRQWQYALAVLDAAKSDGIVPNVPLMSGVIAACARGGEGKLAISLLRDMQAMGLQPDLLCYTNAIRSAVTEGRIDEADALVEEMEKAGMQLDKRKLMPQ